MPTGVYKRTKKQLENMSKSHIGKKYKPTSEQGKKNLSIAGKIKGNKKKFREFMSLINSGKNNPSWRGGISFEPYTTDWTETLKRSIRERDKYTCQICGKEPSIYCHHIDYDKKNCNPNNLITLCHSCHAKTNHNRQHWIIYFRKGE